MKLPDRNKILKTKKIIYKPYKQSINLKPAGVWYSCGNKWYAWCKKEGMENYLHKYIHQININKTNITTVKNKDKNKLLIIKCIKDFDTFNKRYGVKTDLLKTGKMVDQLIDWSKVARDYGGIEICPYFATRRKLLWYSAFDVAGGCVWRVSSIIKDTKVIYKKEKDKYKLITQL
jgi:hypothetical protein